MKTAYKLRPGMKFGHWTVLDESGVNEKGEATVKCRCDCGTERFVLQRALKYGSSKSCGCSRKESASCINLEGQTFGELTVLRKADDQTRNGGVWWLCRCSCGEEYEVPATLLTTGRRTHCGNIKNHRKNYAVVDISGKRFNMLTALYPTDKRDEKGNVIWHCKCDCGNEIDFSYNTLMYTNTKSCGCRKQEHEKNLKNYIDFVDGTSVDHLSSTTIPKNNMTGVKGVYCVRGKYIAKIVIQKKQYILGTFSRLEDAAAARKEVENTIRDTVVPYYERWKALADRDSEWALNNPVKISVKRDAYDKLRIDMQPNIVDL